MIACVASRGKHNSGADKEINHFNEIRSNPCTGPRVSLTDDENLFLGSSGIALFNLHISRQHTQI